MRKVPNDGDAKNPVLVPGRETDNESNSKSIRDRDSYTVTSKVTVTLAVTQTVTILRSLSTRVFETRTATAREHFAC